MEELDEDIFFSDEELEGVSESGGRPEKTKSRPEKKSNNHQVNKVIKTARSYTGTPYKWGGMTRAGMDCSGLLCTSFRSVDIILPRTSAEQSHFGKAVKLGDLEEGDLVFFSERRSVKRISHVGMVTEVNGKDNVKFIHASTKLGVVENNLYSPYYLKIFVKAVRPFN